MTAGVLRSVLDDTALMSGLSLKDLRVLSPQTDPFNLDTPRGNRDGQWLAATTLELVGDRRIHLRGLHYVVIGHPKPDGSTYTNTDADWTWLSAWAAKAARWLGYLPFEQITDQRNAEPTVTRFERPDPYPFLSVGIDVEIPDVDDLEPRVGVHDFVGGQPYKLVIIGEKASLRDVLEPIAREHLADLYLPTGEISDTLLFQMARIGAEDGRPMVVFYFSDADPSGWQMPISVSRKLQAFQQLQFPDLQFQVHRVALTPDQVRRYGLPSTPTKDTEMRGDRWTAAMGVEQTEIDSLAALQPDLLQQIATDAISPFFDRTLDQRVRVARRDYLARAQEVVDAHLAEDGGRDLIRTQASAQLRKLAAEISAIEDAMQIDSSAFALPDPVVPDAVVDGIQPLPLVDSRWSFADQCQTLIASKGYLSGGDRG